MTPALKAMSLRAALYARFSTDRQNEASVADQLRLCRPLAQDLGAHVVAEEHDEISGFTAARPGLNRLLDLVRRGGCDVVIAEHSDRIARDGEKSWQVFNLFREAGVRYVTVQEGEVSIVHQGVSSLVSELKGEEVTLRTRRGLRGRVEAGRSAGGLSYGYRKKRLYDAAGEPIRGHLEIDEDQALVVREIFTRYAAGESPRAIVADLNARAIPAPRGGLWGVSTIVGNARRGNGVIHNALYAGSRIWGRQTFVKNRVTGARRGRAAATAPLERPQPELRIVPAELWDQARQRHAAASRVSDHGAAPSRAVRPKRFLQGLIKCDLCGGTMQRSGPKLGLACATRLAKGACANDRRPGYMAIEARVITALRTHLLRPDAIELAVRTIQDALQADAREATGRTAHAVRELAETKRRMARLIDQLEQGVPWSAIAPRHAELDARRAALEAQLADHEQETAEILAIPVATAGMYRRLIEDLEAALENPGDPTMTAGRDAVRRLIDRVRFVPLPGHNAYDLVIEGDLAPLLMLNPETQKARLAAGFSGALSKGTMGAGTRSTHDLGPLAAYELAA